MIDFFSQVVILTINRIDIARVELCVAYTASLPDTMPKEDINETPELLLAKQLAEVISGSLLVREKNDFEKELVLSFVAPLQA